MKSSLYTKVLLLIIGITLGIVENHAQQISTFQQYLSKPILFNPARVGARGQAGLSLGFRQQWIGFGTSPRFGQLHVHFSPHKGNVLGLGILFNHQDVSLLSRNDVSLLGAVHVLSDEQHQLSLGLSFGLNQFGLKGEEFSQNIDPLLSGANFPILLDGGLGLSYSYTKSLTAFHADLVFGQLPSSFGIELGNSIYNFSTYTHLAFATRLALPIANEIQLEPGIMYRRFLGNYALDSIRESSIRLGGGDLDVQVRLLLNRYNFWVGLGFRSSLSTSSEITSPGFAGLNGSFGFELNEKISLSGTYDHNKYLGSSFELGLAYSFQSERERRTKDSFDKIVQNADKYARRRSLYPTFDSKGLYYGSRNTAKLSYSYNDIYNEYQTASTPKLETAIAHVEEMIVKIWEVGAVIDSIHFIGEIREEPKSLATLTDQVYEGDSLQISYVFNRKESERSIEPGKLDLEALMLYKLSLIRDKLLRKPNLQISPIKESAMRLVIQTEANITPVRRNTILLFLRKNN